MIRSIEETNLKTVEVLAKVNETTNSIKQSNHFLKIKAHIDSMSAMQNILDDGNHKSVQNSKTEERAIM
eukprot:CAMPEP_0168607774 /NCGR_PEP_ID=MMETSP0449_2-20121227/245_1 /TAXON_ID=1082188 /ORGANISM="Strombidium rassoulzadegani, Strain ras09" /LENGTH=68 /DNA_ID=CAMNT_0008647659 /DNA_START=226 /DNA_END=432 /DNA_ORIENTATION=-